MATQQVIDCKVGDAVQFENKHGSISSGIIRYLGPLIAQRKVYAGIKLYPKSRWIAETDGECIDPRNNKSLGWFFRCSNSRETSSRMGIYVNVSKIKKRISTDESKLCNYKVGETVKIAGYDKPLKIIAIWRRDTKSGREWLEQGLTKEQYDRNPMKDIVVYQTNDSKVKCFVESDFNEIMDIKDDIKEEDYDTDEKHGDLDIDYRDGSPVHSALASVELVIDDCGDGTAMSDDEKEHLASQTLLELDGLIGEQTATTIDTDKKTEKEKGKKDKNKNKLKSQLEMTINAPEQLQQLQQVVLKQLVQQESQLNVNTICLAILLFLSIVCFVSGLFCMYDAIFEIHFVDDAGAFEQSQEYGWKGISYSYDDNAIDDKLKNWDQIDLDDDVATEIHVDHLEDAGS